MKEVRFNDKIWFGKHKGLRICEVIKLDPIFVQKLVTDNKIKLDERSMNNFQERIGIKKSRFDPARYGLPPIGDEAQEDQENQDFQEDRGAQISRAATNFRCHYSIEEIRQVINVLIGEVFRDVDAISPTQCLSASDILYDKIVEIQDQIVGNRVRLSMIRNPIINNRLRGDTISLMITADNGTEISTFDLRR
jgi:hypothetical protein